MAFLLQQNHENLRRCITIKYKRYSSNNKKLDVIVFVPSYRDMKSVLKVNSYFQVVAP